VDPTVGVECVILGTIILAYLPSAIKKIQVPAVVMPADAIDCVTKMTVRERV